LGQCDITVNKNTVPFETRSPFVTSGIRLGTSAVTTRGLKEADMEAIAALIDEALMNPENTDVLNSVKTRVHALMAEYPLYA
jgi:glycine hydroxymethyltransferase